MVASWPGALEALSPGLPVLYMSGYTDDEIVRRGLLEAGQPFLQKPFNPETLGGQVARMLQGRRSLTPVSRRGCVWILGQLEFAPQPRQGSSAG